jgi:hypothetical protein
MGKVKLVSGIPVICVAFSPDDRTIVSATQSGAMVLTPGKAGPQDLRDKLTVNMSRKQWREWVSPEILYMETCPGLLIPADGDDEDD